jgi:hypothetical protein
MVPLQHVRQAGPGNAIAYMLARACSLLPYGEWWVGEETSGEMLPS